MDAVGEVLALPEEFPGLFVQGNQIAAFSAGGENHLLAIDQRHAAVAPFGQFAAKIVNIVFPPDFLARGRFQTNYFAILADGVEQITIDGGRAARPLEMPPARPASLADLRIPEWRAVGHIERKHLARIVLIAHREQPIAHDSNVRVANPHARGLPKQFGAVLRPLLQ